MWIWCGTLEELNGEGKLKQVNATAAAFSLLGMIMWLARWFRPDGGLSRERVAEELCKIALGGLLETNSSTKRHKVAQRISSMSS